MSISKYHVSKNLFNPSTVETGYINDANGNVGHNSNSKSSDYIEVSPNTNYYITYIPSGRWGAWYDDNKTYISGITGYNVVASPNNAKYMRVTANYAGSNPDYATNFMVAKSANIIPYEPYGNSWNEVGYKKYETATDTITSLPKTIIGDGQNISAYTIKGNMTQSGTPTPSTPIYPTEVGDKTANLFDKADTSLQSHLCYNSNNDTLKIGLAIGSIVLPCSPNTTYSIRRKGGLSDTFNACYTTETPDENVSAYGYVESSDRYTVR